jgi:membrane protease YdiL (CAAX protease family)
MVAVSIIFEEAVYRGFAAAVGTDAWWVLVAGGVAFVASRHASNEIPDGARRRMVRYQTYAALLLGGLVAASGSLWPALLAHAIANLPSTVLDWQRTRSDVWASATADLDPAEPELIHGRRNVRD